MPYPTFDRIATGRYRWLLGAQFDRNGDKPCADSGIVERTTGGGWRATAPGVDRAGYGKTKQAAVLALTNVRAT